MRTADFDYDLPPELIAQSPAPERDGSRLLVLDRASGQIQHRRFRDLLDYLRAGDLLLLNNSRVIPARLRGVNARGGGQFEVLLLEENAPNDWWVLLRPGKRARIGTHIVFNDRLGRPSLVQALVTETNAEGHRRLGFQFTRPVAQALWPASSAAVAPAVLSDRSPDLIAVIEALGEVPLPPYIARSSTTRMEQDRERYQTVFAQPAGSVAAPTAGLHFTEPLLDRIRARGVEIAFLTLHVGLGTFAPVKAEAITGHLMHEERYALSDETARRVNAARREGRRVVAVGTTTLRVLETLALENGQVQAGAGKTRLFIYPPYRFKAVDALLTNFHLPRSTLLLLVSAFAAPGRTRGRELALSAYAEAIRQQYRFFSYGDAMLIL